MFKRSLTNHRTSVSVRPLALLVCAAVAALLLAGCGGPTYSTRPPGYGAPPPAARGAPPPPSGSSRNECYQGCGYVRSIRAVQLGNKKGALLGTVIVAAVGGLAGHQVGGGKGKTAATIAGAVAGGIGGHAVGKREGQGRQGWQIVVQLNDGKYATVTQRTQPQVRIGDYVMIRGDQVYRY
jgi:outer membrane lipoprotein SlyB